MSDVKTIFAEKKFPLFITTHSVFRTFKEVRKVFPEIGLPNTEKEIEVDNKKEAEASAQMLVAEIQAMIDKRLRTINKFAAKKAATIDAEDTDKKKPMGKRRKRKLENVVKLLTEIRDEILKSKGKFLITNNGRVTLNIPKDVSDIDDKVAFKTGEGLFRVYNKLNEVLREGHFLAMTKLEDLAQFKDFSAKNVPALKYKVRFASDGSEGAWDIATMSMRGVSSCQSWANGAHHGTFTHIVGSIVDPFTGIIYLTSGAKFNEHGTKMIRRCVVRFMVDEETKNPFIALERMYPAMEKPALDAFMDFLRERTDNKFDVVYLPEGRKQGYVPLSKIVGTLSAQDQPYRDSQVPYKQDVNDVQGRLRQTLTPKLEAIYAAHASKVVAAARAMKVGSVPEDSKNAFKALRGTDYNWDCSYNLYQDLMADIREFFEKRKIETYEDSELYLKEGLEAFMTEGLEERIFRVVKKSARDRIHKSRGQVADEVIAALSKTSTEKMKVFLEGEIKKIKKIKIDDKKTGGKKSGAASAIPIYTKLLN